MEKLKHVGMMVFGILILAYVVSQIGINEIMPALRGMNRLVLAGVISIEFLVVLVWNAKWNVIVNKFTKIKYTQLLPIFMSGLAINNLTPGPRIGGEPVRAHYLGKRADISGSEALGTATLDVITHISVFAVFALIAMLFVLFYTEISVFRTVLGIILAFSLGVLAWMIYAIITRGRVKKPRRRAGWLKKTFYKSRLTNFITDKFATYDEFDEYLHLHIKKFKDTLKVYWKDKKSLGVAFIFSIAVHGLNYLKNYMIFVGLGQEISFLHVFVVITVSIVISLFIWVPGGTGIVEAVMIAMYTSFGVSMPIAAAATLLSRALFYFTTYVLGYSSLWFLTLRYGKAAD